MSRVFVSIGSNIEREHNIRSAMRDLRKRFGQLTVSRVFESKAVGFLGDDFLNLVVGFDTEATVWKVIAELHDIEMEHSRARQTPRFSSRTLDLDLLLYDDLVLEERGIKLPRDEITRYAYVLGPLAEIAGKMRHPVEGRPFTVLWQEFDHTTQPIRPVEFDIG